MKNTVFGTIALVIATATYANSDADNMDEVGAYTEMALSSVEQSSMDASAMIDEYLNSSAGARLQGPDLWTGQSVAIVSVSNAHRDWSKHRALAFKQAWSDVQENFIMFQNSETSTELIRKLYQDASGEMPEYRHESYTGSDAVDEFIDKSGAYISSKMDTALENAGVDPEEYSRGNSKQRKVLLEEAMQQKIVTRSLGKLTGLLPVKTFVTEVDGRYSIGVVGLYKPSFEEVASQIAKGQIPQSNNKQGKPLRNIAPSDPRILASTFGVHLVRDEWGYPALISFGQWGVSGTHQNPTIAAKFKQVAIKQARSQADAEISLFLNGSANLVDESYVGSIVEAYIDVDRSGFSQASDSTGLTDLKDQVLTSRAKVKLSGLTDIRTWVYRDPKSGQTMVGVVRLWSSENARAAAAIKSTKHDRESSKSTAQAKSASAEPKPHSRTSTSSPDLGSPDDF